MTNDQSINEEFGDSNHISLKLGFYAQSVSFETVFRPGLNIYELSNVFDSSIFRSNEQVLAILYSKILRRNPDAAGFQNHLSALNNGIDVSALANSFLSSEEFKSLDDKSQLDSILFMNLLSLRSYDYLRQIDYDTFLTILKHGLFYEYCVLRRCFEVSEIKSELFNISKHQDVGRKDFLRKYWIKSRNSKPFKKSKIVFRVLVFPIVRRRLIESLEAESLKIRTDYLYVVQYLFRE